MTHLGRFFQEQQEAQNITAKDLAARMHVDPTLISRAKRGERRSFEPGSLVRMIAGISNDPIVKLEFVRAIMLDFRDQCAGIDRKALDVVIRKDANNSLRDETAHYQESPAKHLAEAVIDAALSSSDIDALVILAIEFRRNPALRRAILALAELARQATKSHK